MTSMPHSTNTYCVIGPPGCGKTHSIAQSIQRNIPLYGETGIIVCSLTKTAAREASGRVGLPHSQVGTLHHFARQAIGGGMDVAESHIDEWNKEFPFLKVGSDSVNDDIDDVTYDMRVCQSDGDKTMSKMNLLRARCVSREAWPSDVRLFSKKWDEWKQAMGYIDFADMIEIAANDTVQAPGAPRLIYLDEAQDSSIAESRLLANWGKAVHKLVIVGDPLQSLYEWRGATPEEFFPPDQPAERKHVLAQSYRVPDAVRQAAIRWVSGMKGYQPEPYHPRKDEAGEQVAGSARHLDESLQRPDEILNIISKTSGTVMILASCGYMLNPVIAALREAGIPFHNQYRRKNGAWNPLHGRGVTGRDRLLSFVDPPFGQWSMSDVKKWASVLASDGIINRGCKKEIELADDDTPPHEITGTLIDQWFAPDAIEKIAAMDARWWFNHLSPAKKRGAEFPLHILEKSGIQALSEQPRVTVGTIHSVKGGEADTVILAPDLSRAGYEEYDMRHPGVWRLFYVGMTRARENLILLSASGKMAVEW